MNVPLHVPLHVVGVWLDVQFAFVFFGQEVGADERIDVAVEDAIYVAYFELRAVVFDHAVGLHDVGADLAAEGDVELGFVELVGVLLALLDFEVVEFRAKHLHRQGAVFALAAFGLAGYYRVGGEVGDADGGFHLVYVLPAFAAGAVGVYAEFFGADVDLDAVVDFRDYEYAGEGGVATGGLVERGDADETVDAGFSGEQTVGVFAFELDGGGLDAGFFAGGFVEDYGVHAFALGPTEVHPEEDAGPVLRFGAACTGLDGHDGIEVVGLAGEQRAGFLFGYVVFRGD